MVTLLKSILTRIMIYMLHVVFTPEMTLGRVLLLPNQKGPALNIPEKNALNILQKKKIKKLIK